MIRGRILLSLLLLTGALAAAAGILQMWWAPLSMVVFSKSMITLLIAGVLLSFLAAVDYDLPGSRKKLALLGLVALSLLAGGLVVAQMWWDIIPVKLFGKIIITVVILGAFLSFITAVSEDFGTAKKLKDDKYID